MAAGLSQSTRTLWHTGSGCVSALGQSLGLLLEGRGDNGKRREGFLHHYVIAMAIIPVSVTSRETVPLFSVAPPAGQ